MTGTFDTFVFAVAIVFSIVVIVVVVVFAVVNGDTHKSMMAKKIELVFGVVVARVEGAFLMVSCKQRHVAGLIFAVVDGNADKFVAIVQRCNGLAGVVFGIVFVTHRDGNRVLSGIVVGDRCDRVETTTDVFVASVDRIWWNLNRWW